MDSARQTIEQRFNGLVVFFMCLLIYFLPISIALTETMSGFVILFVVLKKILLNAYDIKRMPADSPLSAKFRLIGRSLLIPGFLNQPMWIYLFVSAMTVVLSQFVMTSFIAFLGKLLEGYLIYFAFADCFKRKEHIRNFLAIYLVSTLLMGINGIAQYLTHTEFVRNTPLVNGRVSSSMRHANDFGAYLLFIIPILLSLLLTPWLRLSFLKEWKMQNSIGGGIGIKIFLFLLFTVIVICEGLTFSRGAWVAFLFSLAALVLFQRRGYLWGAGVAVLFLCVFMPFLAKTRDVSFVSDNVTVQAQVDLDNKGKNLEGLPPLKRWIEENKHYGFSGMGRTGFWGEAMRIIEEHPWFGSGLNTYAKMARRFGYAHNCYLQMAAETGVIGVITFVALMICFFGTSLGALRSVSDPFLQAVLSGALAGLLAFLIQIFFDTTFYSVQLSHLMWIIMGLIAACSLAGRSRQN